MSINTRWPENLGLIVRVVRPHINSPAWNFGDTPAWWCVCEQPMTWHFSKSGRVVRDFAGPIPDASLRRSVRMQVGVKPTPLRRHRPGLKRLLKRS